MRIHEEYPDVVIAGTGIRKIKQMTLETWDYLQHSEVVISNLNDPLAREVLSRELDADLVDYTGRYDPIDEDRRYGTYYEIIAAPLEIANEIDGLVTVITAGHPSIWAYTTQMTKFVGEEYWDLDVEILPGISASAAIYPELNIDPAENGVQECSAPEAVTRQLDLNPEFTYFGWLFSRIPDEASLPSHVDPMEAAAEYFGSQYSPDTEAYLVRATKSPLAQSAVMEIKIRDIKHLTQDSIMGCTLVIPGERESVDPNIRFPPQWDDEMVEEIKSGKKRDGITYPDPAIPYLAEENEDLLEVICRIYTDRDFFRDVRENPEETLEPYDLTDYEFTEITEQTLINSFDLTRHIKEIQNEHIDA